MARPQRYFASSASVNGLENGDAPGDEGDEDDFMSDRFVAAASAASANQPKSYTQMRKEALKQKEERGYIQSRAEREKQAREEGLKRKLIETPSTTSSAPTSATPSRPSGNNTKALDMMLKMGFKPGEALGKKLAPMSTSASLSIPEENADDFIPLQAGIGSKRSAAEVLADSHKGKEKADDRRVDPIEIQMRLGRAGLGLEEAKRRRLTSQISGASQELNIDDYRSRARSNHNERRAEGQLISARRTCQSLDQALGIKSNHIWLDPLEEYRKEKALNLGLQRFGPRGRLGDFGAVDEGDDEAFGFGDDQGHSRGAKTDGEDAEIEIEMEDEAFEEDEIIEREEARRDFLLQDATERLKRTVAYLRQKHLYCLWCGAKYDSKEEMKDECPGTEEEDH